MEEHMRIDESQKELNFEKGDTDDSYPLDEYKLTTTPNDFNILTIVSFIESKVFKIPSFQRHYVWDHKRASKLIESLLIGLPIPQMFLYEQARNEYLVIDGQQRLMTIYYFVKGRFPRKEKRSELREIFDQHGIIPEKIMNDDNFFKNFSLKLDGIVEGAENKFHGKNYKTLGDFQTSLNLATIRNMVVKPVSGDDENGAMFEIFNRLNSGGVNLGAQEIRMSLYHSDFLKALLEMNKDERWRRLLGKDEPDIRLNDVETILRGFAMASFSQEYRTTVNGFINKFANHAKSFNNEQIEFFKKLWDTFLSACTILNENVFKVNSNRFSVMLFESIFYALTQPSIEQHKIQEVNITNDDIVRLKKDEYFQQYTSGKTTQKTSIHGRLKRALDILQS